MGDLEQLYASFGRTRKGDPPRDYSAETTPWQKRITYHTSDDAIQLAAYHRTILEMQRLWAIYTFIIRIITEALESRFRIESVVDIPEAYTHGKNAFYKASFQKGSVVEAT